MDKMRNEFEAWVVSEFNYDVSKSSNGTYCELKAFIAWEAWKASRACLCVELPEQEVAGKFVDEFEYGHEMGFNDALSDCKVAIEKSGVSHK